MSKPVIYIHRASKFYYKYMTPENLKILESFAIVKSPKDKDTKMTEDELIKDLEGVNAILSLNGIGAQEITTEVLEKVKTVEVAVFTHYFAPGCHEIAIPQWLKAGVKVIDASDVVSASVAEWVIGTSIIGMHRLNEYNEELKSGNLWVENFRGHTNTLYKSTIGILGLGRVGQFVANYFKPFGARVIAYDKYISSQKADSLGVEIVPLDYLLEQSDIISINLPVTDETTGLLDKNKLSLIKDGAIFINSGRAPILEVESFYNELKKQRFYAFLDVFHTEPLPIDDSIREMKNAFITPHIAGYNNGMFEKCGREGIRTLAQYFGVNISDYKEMK